MTARIDLLVLSGMYTPQATESVYKIHFFVFEGPINTKSYVFYMS